MRSAISHWIRRARERLPEPQLLLVPGHYFYAHRFEIAASMTRAEVEAFLALALEGTAPFPLEHLVWGFIYQPGESHALVYATARQRLRALGDKNLETFYHAYPGFVSRLGLVSNQARVSYLSQNGSLSALFFQAGCIVPEKIISREITADLLTDEALLESREALHASIDTNGYLVEEGLWVGEGTQINAKGQPVFHHRRLGAAADETADHCLDRDGTGLWELDLRDSAFAHRHLRSRRLANRLWMGMQGLAAMLIVLILLQLGTWAIARATGWIDDQINARFEAAEQINKSKEFIERLDADSAQSLDPVRMLVVVNEVRPKAIYFKNAGASKAKDSNTMELKFEGECSQGAGTVNSYADALRTLDSVLMVNQSVAIKDGRTHFEMTVSFDPARLSLKAIPDLEAGSDSGESAEPTEPAS